MTTFLDTLGHDGWDLNPTGFFDPPQRKSPRQGEYRPRLDETGGRETMDERHRGDKRPGLDERI